MDDSSSASYNGHTSSESDSDTEDDAQILREADTV
jgi:hypothetical protein